MLWAVSTKQSECMGSLGDATGLEVFHSPSCPLFVLGRSLYVKPYGRPYINKVPLANARWDEPLTQMSCLWEWRCCMLVGMLTLG